jgi:hypothetical protein
MSQIFSPLFSLMRMVLIYTWARAAFVQPVFRTGVCTFAHDHVSIRRARMRTVYQPKGAQATKP